VDKGVGGGQEAQGLIPPLVKVVATRSHILKLSL